MNAWPQWTILLLHILGTATNVYSDGKKESLSGVVISLSVCAVFLVTLYYGGFWSVWGITP